MKRRKLDLVKHEPKQFITIQPYFFDNPFIDIIDKALLTKIEYWQNSPKDKRDYCFASTKKLVENLGISERTARRRMSELKKKGYLTLEFDPIDNKIRKLRVTPEARSLGIKFTKRTWPKCPGNGDKLTRYPAKMATEYYREKNIESNKSKDLLSDFSSLRKNRNFSSFNERTQKIVKTWNHCKNLIFHNLEGKGLLRACTVIEDEVLPKYDYREIINTIFLFDKLSSDKNRFRIPEKGVSLKDFFILNQHSTAHQTWFSQLVNNPEISDLLNSSPEIKKAVEDLKTFQRKHVDLHPRDFTLKEELYCLEGAKKLIEFEKRDTILRKNISPEVTRGDYLHALFSSLKIKYKDVVPFHFAQHTTWNHVLPSYIAENFCGDY
ncbi:MAG: helix-turn-helix domain-containing protein [Desulfatiglandaceae bacterium]